MKHHTRRAVAYIAGRAISGKSSGAVFDFSASQHYYFGGNVHQSQVAVFDYTQSCHITGTLTSLFHYGDSHHISLTINGSQFNGFDYGESCHFSGNVNGNSISVFDYGTSQHYNYSI